MKIKRYIGNNEQEAMYKLKKELGPEAVILHTRKIKQPGILGFFKKSLIEIVAAVDDDNKTDKTTDNEKSNFINFKPSNDTSISKNKNSSYESNSDILWIKRAVENIIDKLDIESKPNCPAVVENIKTILLNNGVEKEVVDNVFDEISKQVNLIDKDEETIKKIILFYLNDYLGEPQPISLDGKQKIVFFIGPTGVGKTTTLAKLAAHFVLKGKHSVGLITADTYRIAAVEQLKTYSEILNIPLKIIYETKEIFNVLSNFKDKEIILIDTAGRNHKNSQQMSEIKELIDCTINKEVYLVVNASTDYKTLKVIMNEYNLVDNFKIIFTKVDESDNLGIILNTRFFMKNPLSYITTGQNVPEDIEIANANKISKSLIGEFKYE